MRHLASNPPAKLKQSGMLSLKHKQLQESRGRKAGAPRTVDSKSLMNLTSTARFLYLVQIKPALEVAR